MHAYGQATKSTRTARTSANWRGSIRPIQKFPWLTAIESRVSTVHLPCSNHPFCKQLYEQPRAACLHLWMGRDAGSDRTARPHGPVRDGRCDRMTEKFSGRREDHRLLTGRGRYANDQSLPGQLHAVFRRSDRAHARLQSVDKTLPNVCRPGVPSTMVPLRMTVSCVWRFLL